MSVERRRELWGALAVAAEVIGGTLLAMIPAWWPIGAVVMLAGVVPILLWLLGGKNADASPLEPARKIKDWGPIDRIDAFRLGQWAAIISGYNYPADWREDPAPRPWKDEFFFLKRAVQAGKFKVRECPIAKNIKRTTLVYRDEITKFYEASGRRVPALFPDERGKG